MSLYVKRKPQPVINVIPLIDVMTVLIVFLLITTHFEDPNSLNIRPPAAESAAKTGDSAESPVVLAVDKTGALFLNAVPVARDAVVGELRRPHEESAPRDRARGGRRGRADQGHGLRARPCARRRTHSPAGHAWREVILSCRRLRPISQNIGHYPGRGVPMAFF